MPKNVQINGDMTISESKLGVGTTTPSCNLEIYNEADSIAKVTANTATAYVEIQTDLTADTFGSAPNIKSKNESQVVNKYTWNSSPIQTGAWYSGVAKDQLIEGVTDVIKYCIGTGNKLGNSKLVIGREGNVGIGKTSPAHRLDVSGNVNATNYLVNSNVGFSGTGSFTNFTIENGIITHAT